MDATELKVHLIEVQEGNRIWDDENKVLLVRSMIEHIGSTDSELRDNLIYNLFCQLILEKNQLDHKLLYDILEWCVSKTLFVGIGENGTDSVFTRSFTLLLIALILYRDNADNFLGDSMIFKTKDALIEYMILEKDLRGYVPEKGWAHSIAHAADAIDELVKNPNLARSSYHELVEVLWKTMFVSTSVYIHDEDERIIVPLLAMVSNGLNPDILQSFIQGIPAALRLQKEQLSEENYWFLYANSKTFLKSLYREMNSHSDLHLFVQSIDDCLRKM